MKLHKDEIRCPECKEVDLEKTYKALGQCPYCKIDYPFKTSDMEKIEVIVNDSGIMEVEAELHPHPFNKKSKLAVHKRIVDHKLVPDPDWVVTDVLYGSTISYLGKPTPEEALQHALEKLKKVKRKGYKDAISRNKTVAEYKLKALYGKDKAK